ncbi:MAG: hypothetical protein VX089_02405 [Pseudomonadota bacterium]|nr:hypothetical protein [Pseudomonadota bacterium]
MYFDIENYKKKVDLKQFQYTKKQILKKISIRYNKKKLSDFSFLHQNNKKLFKTIDNINNTFTNFERILLVGTGGSSLGSKAILEAAFNNKITYLENIDPNYLVQKISAVKGQKLLLLIISKSGETTEILSIFQVLETYFPRLFNFKDDSIIITENRNSLLNNISNERKIKFIEHNPDIGGRFSCFSETGLLPAKLVGLNTNYIKKLSDKTFIEYLEKNKFLFAENISTLFNLIKKKYKGHVVLSYQESLQSMLLWYRQLWGESLGKKGKGIHLMPAIGSIDQHSQLQMWLDGPDNLIYTIILPQKRIKDFKIKDKFKILPDYLNNKSLGNILNSMGIATFKELVRANRPVRVIYLDSDSLYPAIKLMSYFMLEVAVLGKQLDINPFNQPAVEKVKLLTKKILKKNGKS